MLDKFWMVLADNSSVTTKKHANFDLAKAEAVRLARQNPGIGFYVLGCEGEAKIADPVKWEASLDIPF